jgi:hypothetical protein
VNQVPVHQREQKWKLTFITSSLLDGSQETDHFVSPGYDEMWHFFHPLGVC